VELQHTYLGKAYLEICLLDNEREHNPGSFPKYIQTILVK